MPFIAKHKDTGERIDITTIEKPRQQFKPGDCVCPLCAEAFIIKAGLVIAPHFAHKTVCASDCKTHPESEQHNAGKLYLRENLRRDVAEYKDAAIDLEVFIPEINRRADVMVTLPTGWRIAHEVQLASITTEALEERTYDYNSAGIDVVWWLGGHAATRANEDWCHRVFGFCLTLNFVH